MSNDVDVEPIAPEGFATSTRRRHLPPAVFPTPAAVDSPPKNLHASRAVSIVLQVFKQIQMKPGPVEHADKAMPAFFANDQHATQQTDTDSPPRRSR